MENKKCEKTAGKKFQKAMAITLSWYELTGRGLADKLADSFSPKGRIVQEKWAGLAEPKQKTSGVGPPSDPYPRDKQAEHGKRAGMRLAVVH